MNERDIFKKSVYSFLVGCVLFLLIGLFLKDISFLFGFILGYIVNIIAYVIIIKMTDAILALSHSVIFVIIGSIVKMGLYFLGFYIAVKSRWFHLVSTFFGYLVINITIYINNFINKGGEIDG